MIGIVCHDAGGANILSSFVKHNREDYLYHLSGPAVSIFRNKLGKLQIEKSLEDCLSKISRIICGTSWDSNIELKAIKLAKKNKIKTVAFLDHWINYKERFLLDGELILPDELWVGDIFAQDIANKTFGSFDVPVVFYENPYFVDLINYSKTCPSSLISASHKKVLYICEPITEFSLKEYGHNKGLGYTETEAIDYFIKNLKLVSENISFIVIRPHPSENIDKYNGIVNKYMPILNKNNVKLLMSNNPSLIHDIMDSDVVVGCESMALVMSVLANKKTISCIPPGGKSCALPFDNIIKIQNLLGNHET